MAYDEVTMTDEELEMISECANRDLMHQDLTLDTSDMVMEHDLMQYAC